MVASGFASERDVKKFLIFMCGITGICYYRRQNQRELEETVKKINQSQAKRGPDDQGVFIDEKNGVVFGHRRLSIIDLSRTGHQPMIRQSANNKSQIVITFNGEIYNFLELKKELKKKGYEFRTKTDTEVILALYAEYGEKSFSMLRGMFAFGLWDDKQKKLFLVKDRYGIKPLYYYDDKEKLVFASTVKAMAASNLVPRQKNPSAFIGFLLFGSVPLPMTTLRNVLAVPAGHYLEINAAGNQKLIKYYEPLDFFKNKFTSSQDVNFKIQTLLEESVKLHLISDAPLGVFLSGGLDSSAIAALSAEALREGGASRKITTLSVIFDEKEFSEEKYSDLVAAKIRSEHRKIKITKKDFFDSFDEIFEAMDQPTIDGINTFFISCIAQKAGLKAVLSGLGADEIFLGYPYFRKAGLLRNIQKLPNVLKSPLALISLFSDRYSKLNYFSKSDILSFYLGMRGLFSPKKTAMILGVSRKEVQEFIDNLILGTSDVLRTSEVQRLDAVNLLSYLELKFYLQNQLLKDTDFMSMRHSIEVRVPFLDHLLVEYLSGLPPELKLNPHSLFRNSKFEIRNLRLKPLLAAAVYDMLPQEVLSRSKMGFTFPFEKWFKEERPFKGHWSRHWAKEVLKKSNVI